MAEPQPRLSNNKDQSWRACPFAWFQTRAGGASGQWPGLDKGLLQEDGLLLIPWGKGPQGDP